MKIVFLVVKFLGGRKCLGESPETEYWLTPIRQLGHELIPIEVDEYLVGMDLPGRTDFDELLARIDSEVPDLVFINDYENDSFSDKFWSSVRAICPTACWFGDDNHRYAHYTRSKAKRYTIPVTCDPFSYPLYLEDGYSQTLLSQWGTRDYDTVVEEFVDLQAAEVTFVGTFSPYRQFIRKSLQKSGIAVRFYGPGWEGGRVSLGQMKFIFRNSKINLSLEKLATNTDFRYMLSRPRTFLRYALNFLRNEPAIIRQIKARPFEIAACGGFVLLEYAPMIEQYFDLSKEVGVFSSIDELVVLTRFYLRNPNLRLDRAKKSYEKTVREHTMKKRLEKLFSEMNI